MPWRMQGFVKYIVEHPQDVSDVHRRFAAKRDALLYGEPLAMAIREPCPKCKGTGLTPRNTDDVGASTSDHPILSKAPMICSNCGGLGHVTEGETRRRMIEAAKKATG